MKPNSLPLFRVSTIRRGIFALGVCCAAGYFWLASASETDGPQEPIAEKQFTPEEVEAAKKHADFAKLASAKTIVVGKIRVRIDAVLESFPAIYEMTMFVTPSEVIAGTPQADEQFTIRFSRTSKEDPHFDDVPYLIAIGDDKGAERVLLLKPADERLTQVARVAAFHGAADRNKNAALARKNPEMHPLFDELKDVKHLVLLRHSGDANATVSFDAKKRWEEHYNVAVVQSLRGDLKVGVLKRLSFTEEAAASGWHPVFAAVVEYHDGEPVVTRKLLADEERLRVAAAVCETDPATLLKNATAARKEYWQKVSAGRAQEFFQGIFGGGEDSVEPSEESTPSFGGTPSAESFEREGP